MALVKQGEVLNATRTFTESDVEDFARISGDYGDHHMARDAQGRRMVHGLLTASIPTRLGGSIHYLARTMTFEYLRPVWTGDTITASLRMVDVVEESDRQVIHMEVGCVNQHGKQVLKGTSDGVILKKSG
jgi:3-hydroxybutyryl-CoA dehydratase